jgi:hypothetical protein
LGQTKGMRISEDGAHLFVFFDKVLFVPFLTTPPRCFFKDRLKFENYLYHFFRGAFLGIFN